MHKNPDPYSSYHHLRAASKQHFGSFKVFRHSPGFDPKLTLVQPEFGPGSTLI